MKRNIRSDEPALCRGLILRAVLCLIPLSLAAAAGCGAKVQDKAQIYLIPKAASSSFWKSVIAGADTAAHEYHVDLNLLAPANEEDEETQERYMEEAIARGADAVILSAIDYNKLVGAVERALDSGVKIVVIDSDVNSPRVNTHIGTDNYAAGQMAGQAVLDGPEEIKCVGMVNFDANSNNGQERESGCRERIEEAQNVRLAERINVDSNIADASAGTKAMLRQYPQINVIVTFNEWTTLGVGYAIQELGMKEQVRVIGFDSSVISVGMLETGEIDALIVQNQYAMGYLGVEKAYEQITGKAPAAQPEYIRTDTVLITKENMFTPENQKILFPFE